MLSPRLADVLRRGGVDVLAIVEQADLRGLTEVQVLELAAGGSTHLGLIYLTPRRFPSSNAFIAMARISVA
jgi:hypothetical protein